MRGVMVARMKKLKEICLFTAEDVAELGIHATTLGRWAKDGKIERVDRGLFWHPNSALQEDALDYAIACRLFGPEAFIGGLTALAHYQLLDTAPKKIWVVVPHNKATTRKRFRLLHANRDATVGVEKKRFYRISGLERTLAEALYYATKIGADTALTATMNAIHRKQTSPEKILRMAANLNIKSSVMRHWEALVSAQEVAQSV